MKIDCKYWTKENWDIFDSKTQNKILGYFILHGIWIEENNNQSKVLIKLILTLIYDINLKDKNIDCFNKVAQTFDGISKDIMIDF